MKAEVILNKATIGELLRLGTDPNTEVLIPESAADSIDKLSSRVAAELSDSETRIRTTAQNSSLHLYCTFLAKALNSAGWTMKKYFEAKQVDMDWTPEMVKENIWRRIQVAMFNIESTTQLEKDQVSKVYEQITRHHAESLGLEYVPFPNRHGD